jgi:LemA protein
MSGKKIVLIVLGAIILLGLIVFGWLRSSYNGFVTSEEAVKKAWSDVETTYQRRADLIPNLVETVKGYAAHEKDTFTLIAEARAKAGQYSISAKDLDPAAMKKYMEAQQGIGGALTRLLAVAEAYPQLKASSNFQDLQTQLEGTENRINVARTRFNDAARDFNVRIRVFPQNFLARMFGFAEKPYFEAEQGAQVAPKVKF